MLSTVFAFVSTHAGQRQEKAQAAQAAAQEQANDLQNVANLVAINPNQIDAFRRLAGILKGLDVLDGVAMAEFVKQQANAEVQREG